MAIPREPSGHHKSPHRRVEQTSLLMLQVADSAFPIGGFPHSNGLESAMKWKAVGANLSVMERDSRAIRGDGATMFAQIKGDIGANEIVKQVLNTWQEATSAA